MPLFFAVSLYLHHFHLKQTALNRLKSEHVICLTFSYKQAADITCGSEIKVDGKMMDVTSVSNLSDKVLVYGCYDSEEDELNKELEIVLNQQPGEEDGNDLSVKAMQLFTLHYTQQSAVFVKHFPGSISQLYIPFSAALTMVYLPVATPPPLV